MVAKSKITTQVILFVTITAVASQLKADLNFSEDARLNFTEMTMKYGHHAEEHDVITCDGYVLKLFRLPGKKKPVLLLHGFSESSDDWILRGKNSLPIALADNNHDVWIGNSRGNKYSRKHVQLNPDKDAKFWDFSFDEMSRDWMAMIDGILEETEETKINAIGYSQGASSFFALMTSQPKYNEKINLFIALAPIAFYDGVKFGANAYFGVLKAVGANEILTNITAADKIYKLYRALYNTDAVDAYAYDVEPEFLPTILSHSPGGASRKSQEHLYQLASTGKFSRYDYGVEKNLHIYGSEVPPEYDLSDVSAKVAILYGESDTKATAQCVRYLAGMLPNLVSLQAIEEKKWKHLDFILNSEMNKYLFPKIFNLLNVYNNEYDGL